MKMGVVGQKIGMTRIFDENGNACAVTVIEVQPNVISQIKTYDSDGYNAIQVSIGERRLSNKTPKALVGHYAKNNLSVGLLLKEFRVAHEEISNYAVGNEINLSIFNQGQRVDVRGRSIGKGFSGTIKRHNFSGQRKTHGNSLSHRVPGSIGQNQTPGRVFKGKKMSGQMGNKFCSVQNLEIIRIDDKRNLLLVKGAIPGAKGSFVIVRPSQKV